jgi:hypothetical protein
MNTSKYHLHLNIANISSSLVFAAAGGGTTGFGCVRIGVCVSTTTRPPLPKIDVISSSSFFITTTGVGCCLWGVVTGMGVENDEVENDDDNDDDDDDGVDLNIDDGVDLNIDDGGGDVEEKVDGTGVLKEGVGTGACCVNIE